MILWYAAIVFVAGSLHRRWKTPRGAGPSIWFLDLPWGDWSVAIDVASATWQVRACWHSEKAKLEEGRRMQFDDICIYIYTHIIIEGSREANGQKHDTRVPLIHILWPAEISSACVFVFFSEVFNAKQRLGQKPVASVANEIGDQKHGHHEARFPSRSCWIFYWPFTSLLYLGSDGPHGHPRRAAIKDWVKRPSQTSFQNVYCETLLPKLLPDYRHYLLKSLPNFF